MFISGMQNGMEMFDSFVMFVVQSVMMKETNFLKCFSRVNNDGRYWKPKAS